MTVLRTASEEAELTLAQINLPRTQQAIEQRIAGWRKAAERYDSEPETGEGRKELAARAKTAETKRDRALAAYHHFEVASASVQIAIVLASAAIITAMSALIWVSAGLGVLGVVFCGIGFFAPLSVHLF
jgi:lipid II:glycine glycyltransferase (peptidoglycan interpeptide bridge formation enzyme)